MKRTEKTRFRWFTQSMLDLATKLLKEYEVIPMTFMVLTDNGFRTYYFPIESEDHKQKVFEYMSKIMWIHDSEGISMISETWSSTLMEGEQSKYAEPRLDPNREDGLMHFTRIGEKRSFKMYEVKPDRSLKFLWQDNGSRVTTKFDEIFDLAKKIKLPPCPPHERDRMVTLLGEMYGFGSQVLNLGGN